MPLQPVASPWVVARAAIAYDATPEAVAVQPYTLMGVIAVGRNPIKVAKTPLVRGFRWRVEFEGVQGNLGMLRQRPRAAATSPKSAWRK